MSQITIIVSNIELPTDHPQRRTTSVYNFKKPVSFEQMEQLQKEYAEANPEYCVNVLSDDGSFICGQRERERIDEQLMDMGLINWDTYMQRNHPELLIDVNC